MLDGRGAELGVNQRVWFSQKAKFNAAKPLAARRNLGASVEDPLMILALLSVVELEDAEEAKSQAQEAQQKSERRRACQLGQQTEDQQKDPTGGRENPRLAGLAQAGERRIPSPTPYRFPVGWCRWAR